MKKAVSAVKSKKGVLSNEKPVEEHFICPLKKIKLNKTQKNHYKEMLLELRISFQSQVQFHQDDALRSKRDAAGERAGMATHMADLGSDNFRHDLELSLLSEEGDVLQMIDESLQRLEADEFGICLDCGEVITPERLEAKPYARYCVKCKSRHEATEEYSGRQR